MFGRCVVWSYLVTTTAPLDRTQPSPEDTDIQVGSWTCCLQAFPSNFIKLKGDFGYLILKQIDELRWDTCSEARPQWKRHRSEPKNDDGKIRESADAGRIASHQGNNPHSAADNILSIWKATIASPPQKNMPVHSWCFFLWNVHVFLYLWNVHPIQDTEAQKKLKKYIIHDYSNCLIMILSFYLFVSCHIC
jgi:hypothetical protein